MAQNEHDKLLKVIEDKRAGLRFAKAQLELATAKKHVSPPLGNLPNQWAADRHIRVVEDEDGNVTGYEGPKSQSHVEHSRGAVARSWAVGKPVLVSAKSGLLGQRGRDNRTDKEHDSGGQIGNFAKMASLDRPARKYHRLDLNYEVIAE